MAKAKPEPRPQITLKSWGDAFDKAAKIRGWSLFAVDDGRIAIQKIDEVDADAETEEEAKIIRETHTQLNSDLEAYDDVMRLCASSNIMALSALFLDGGQVNDTYNLPSYLAKHPDMVKAFAKPPKPAYPAIIIVANDADIATQVIHVLSETQAYFVGKNLMPGITEEEHTRFLQGEIVNNGEFGEPYDLSMQLLPMRTYNDYAAALARAD